MTSTLSGNNINLAQDTQTMAGNKRKRDMKEEAAAAKLAEEGAIVGLEDLEEDEAGNGKTATTSKCKGATTIPIFLKKTYKMIDTCDSKVASWTDEGDMFVVKDPDVFASSVIPQYFDHNKFSSFARQLNFYGFRKMQSKPIRNSDFDANTAKHVTFYNENFKRGRCDLLKKIQRSTRGGGTNVTGQDQAKEVQQLKDKVTTLEQTITEMGNQMEERMRRLELDMLGRMEQMMLAMQQQQNSSNNTQPNSAISSNTPTKGIGNNNVGQNGGHQQSIGGLGLDPLPFGGARGTSIGSISGLLGPLGGPGALSALAKGNSTAGAPGAGNNGNGGAGGPTLPPHPKMKQLPTTNLPGAVGLPMGRLTSLRGLSNLTRGISGLSRAASTESQGSGLLSNPWEDKFFSMLMAGGGNPADRLNQLAAAQSVGTLGAGAPDFVGGTGMNPTPMADAAAQLNAMNMMNAHAAMVSQGSSLGAGNNNGNNNNSNNNSANTATNTAGV